MVSQIPTKAMLYTINYKHTYFSIMNHTRQATCKYSGGLTRTVKIDTLHTLKMDIFSFASVQCTAETSRRNFNQYLDAFNWYLNKNHIRD
jgi:hypothetical protein